MKIKKYPKNSTFYGITVKAEYRTETVPGYCGNPFIEVLPSEKELGEKLLKLYNIHIFTNDEKQIKDNYTRMIRIGKLRQFYFPFGEMREVAAALDRMIFTSYAGRNPLTPEERKRILEVAQKSNNADVIEALAFPYDGEVESEDMMLLTGAAGIGKSTAIKKIIKRYPQVIEHIEYRGTMLDTRKQIVWLKIDAPFDGNPSTLCYNFFESVDHLLGTNYLKDKDFGQSNYNKMLKEVGRIATLHGVGIIIIDEIQRLANNTEADNEMLEFFTSLSNDVQIPICLIGTLETQKIIFKGRNLRRIVSGGDFTWNRMTSTEDDNWKNLVKFLWPNQLLKNPTELTDEISAALFKGSIGITALLVQLFKLTQFRALLKGLETIDVELINETSENDMKKIYEMIEDIESKDSVRRSKWGDIETELETQLNKSIKREAEAKEYYSNLQKEIDKDKDCEELTTSLIEAILEFTYYDNLNFEEIQAVVIGVIEKNKKCPEHELRKICIKHLDNLDNAKVKKQTKPKKAGKDKISLSRDLNSIAVKKGEI